LRAEGGRTYLGRSAVCSGIGTEGEAILPDRAAEVSRGRSSHASDEGPNGPQKGLMGAASKRRKSWATSGRRTSYCWPSLRNIGVKPRMASEKGSNRSR